MVMKLSVFILLLSAIHAIALDAPKSIALSKTSNVSHADISTLLQKGCPQVSITDDPTKGDYTLEATVKTDLKAAPHEQTSFDLTLFDRDGKLLRSTSNPGLGGAVKDMCNAIKTGVIVEIVRTGPLTQSVDVRGTGDGVVPAVVNATTGRRTHTDTDTILVIINGEHALLDCYERRKGCTTIAPGKYYGELEGGSLWVNYEMPLTHKALRNHYKVAGSW
jgi:hypothetical protein